jgi:multiple sugar transport system permease protein
VKARPNRLLARTVWSWLLLLPLVLLTLFPYAVMLSTALKPASEVYAFPPRWFGSHLAFENFSRIWNLGFPRSLANSLLISVSATLLALLLSFPAAYALSRYRLRRAPSSVYRQFLLLTQMISPIVLAVGIFKVVADLKIINWPYPAVYLPLIVIYAVFNIAFSVWMLQSYFRTIPGELEEAAWIDGCSRAGSFRRVFLPLSLPAVAITALFSFIYCWNEFVLAYLILRRPEQSTVTLQVFGLVGGRYTVEWEQVMAAALIATLPMVLVFVLAQKQIVGGLALGSGK